VNKFLDRLSEFFARRKGLLPIVGLLLVVASFIQQLIWPESWAAQTDLLLHLGVVVAIFGFLVAWAL
jgi:hypothetical protein